MRLQERRFCAWREACYWQCPWRYVQGAPAPEHLSSLHRRLCRALECMHLISPFSVPSTFLVDTARKSLFCYLPPRLRDLEGVGKSLKYYKDTYHPLDDWIQQVETTQRKIQENQPDSSKILATQLNQQKVYEKHFFIPWLYLVLVSK